MKPITRTSDGGHPVIRRSRRVTEASRATVNLHRNIAGMNAETVVADTAGGNHASGIRVATTAPIGKL